MFFFFCIIFFFQAEDGIRYLVRSRGLGDVYKRQPLQLGQGLTTSGANDGFIAKFSAITGIQTFGNLGGGQLHIYANPNNGLCTVDLPQDLRYTSDLVLTIFDAQGRAVQSSPVRSSETGIKLDITAQAKGSYFVELSDGQQRYTGTIVFD